MMRTKVRDVDVLLVGSYPPPHGGQSVHIKNLLFYLKRQGLGAAVVNTGANKTIDGDEVLSVSSSAGLLRTVLFGVNAKVVHVHVARIDDFGKLVPVFLVSLTKRFRWVVTIHSGNIGATLNGAGLFRKIAMKIILPRIDKVICVNEVTKNAFSGWIEQGRFAVISAFSMTFSEERLSREIEDFFEGHRPVICATGFFEPVYGFELAIRGMGELKKTYKDIGLVLIANKRNSHKYEGMIEEYGLESNIMLCGDVTHNQCLSIMSKAALFLRPTLYDGDALSVKEALMLNVPVVASRTEFRPEGVVTFGIGDMPEMVEKVEAVLQGRNTAAREFHGSHDNLEEIKGVYLPLMERRPG